ncbi:MAG: TadE/TadG family type IV pilus assembly protein [Thermaurantiacus sp.]
MLALKASGWRSLRRDRRGAVAAEFGLIAPLFTFLLLGAIEFGCLFFAYSAMQFGATIVTRDMAVNVIDEAEARANVRAFLPPWVRDSATVNVVQSDPFNSTTNLIRMQVQASSLQATPLPLFTRVSPWTITADVTLKQELPYVD